MAVSQAQYFSLSLAAAVAVLYHAFVTRQRFYHAAVYLSTSKLAVAVVGNLAFASALLVHKLVIKLFLGTLRDIEREMIRERLSSAVMESLLALTVFREEFSAFFLGMFATLLFVKVLHWLVQDRVDYIEVTPSVSRLQHLRIVSFMSVLLVLDALFLQYTVQAVVASSGQSVMVLFAFEYVIQASDVVRYFLKYIMSMVDLWLDGRWESKGTYVFYLELITDLLHLFVYVVFFVIVMSNYGFPLHLVRDLYSTFRNFRNRVADFLRFRQVTTRLDRLPDATATDLERSDGVCIICREEMQGAGSNKKLHCGHVFHLHCLRSWLERQQNCPTCRATVFRPGAPNAPAGAAAAAAGAVPAAAAAAPRPAAPAAAAAQGAPAAQPRAGAPAAAPGVAAAGGAAPAAGADGHQHAHGFHIPQHHHVRLGAHARHATPAGGQGQQAQAQAQSFVLPPGMLDMQMLGMMGGLMPGMNMMNPMMPGFMAPLFPTVLPPLFPPPSPNNVLEQQAAAAAAAAALAAATAVGAFNPMSALIMIPPAFFPAAGTAAAPEAATTAAGVGGPGQTGPAASASVAAAAPAAPVPDPMAVLNTDPAMALAMTQLLERQVATLNEQLARIKASMTAATVAAQQQAQAAAASASIAEPATSPAAEEPTPTSSAPHTSTAGASSQAPKQDAATNSSSSQTHAGTGAAALAAVVPAYAPAAPAAADVAPVAPAATAASVPSTAAPVSPSPSPVPSPGAEGADPQSEIRRRRLQHFEQQQQQGGSQ